MGERLLEVETESSDGKKANLYIPCVASRVSAYSAS
jgi:hypothetical protein